MRRAGDAPRTAALVAALALLPSAARAQAVSTSIVARQTGGATFGAAESIQPGLDGRYAIPESQFGYRPGGGGNLFFSFDHFDLGAGDTAVLQGNPAQYVISRVTDGTPSHLYGTFQSEIAGADTLFVNPAGVIFGPNATLDVGGSFHASTADLVRFGEGAQAADWDTTACCSKLATTLPPSAFGFIRPEPADVVFDQRPAGVDPSTTLMVPAGETLSAVGGNVRVTGTGDPVFSTLTLVAQGGAIQLAAVPGSSDPAAPTLVPLDLSRFEARASSDPAVGNVTLENGAYLFTANDDFSGVATSGRVVVRAGRFEVLPSQTSAPVLIESGGDGADPIPPPAIDVEVAGPIEIAQAAVFANAFDFSADGGREGDVRLAGESISLDHTVVLARSAGDATPGTVRLDADTATLAGGSQVGSWAEGSQPGADVEANVGSLTLREGAALRTRTRGAGEQGGNVRVDAGTLDVAGGAILATTESAGRGGDVHVTTTGGIDVTGGGLVATATVPDPDGAVETNTGDAGSVVIVSRGPLRVSGDAISTSEISARAFSVGGIAGAAGSISISAPSLELRDGGLVTANSTGGASAGNIAIDARHVLVTGTGGAQANPSAVIANSRADGGPAGSVKIAGADSVKVNDGGVVSVASSDVTAGPSGNLVIETRELRVHGGSVTTQSFATSGEGGNIVVRGGPPDAGGVAPRAHEVRIFRGQISTEASFEEAGDISISARDLVVQKSDIVSKAGLAGGTLDLAAKALFVPGGELESTGTPGQLAAKDAGHTDSLFDASSRLSVPGSLDVTRPNEALAGQLVSLPSDFYAAEELLRNECEARSAPVGSLILRGRERIPAVPDEELRIFQQGGE